MTHTLINSTHLPSRFPAPPQEPSSLRASLRAQRPRPKRQRGEAYTLTFAQNAAILSRLGDDLLDSPIIRAEIDRWGRPSVLGTQSCVHECGLTREAEHICSRAVYADPRS